MAKRLSVTLADAILEELQDWAAEQGRNTSNLAAFLLERAVVETRMKALSLPEDITLDLQRWAEREGISADTLARNLLINAVLQAREDQDTAKN